MKKNIYQVSLTIEYLIEAEDEDRASMIFTEMANENADDLCPDTIKKLNRKKLTPEQESDVIEDTWGDEEEDE
jgi:hypothetical protein